jgi:hypothetical protein
VARPKSTVVLDRQAVANPEQARKLLSAVEDTKRSGPRLQAFFAGLVPEGMRWAKAE